MPAYLLSTCAANITTTSATFLEFTISSLKTISPNQPQGKIIGKSDPAVIYYNGAHCSLGYRASGMATEWVFTNIYYYRAGFRACRYAGNPIVVGDRIIASQ